MKVRAMFSTMVVCGMVLAGCASSNKEQASGNNEQALNEEKKGEVKGLSGTAWRLEDLGGAGVLPDVEVTLEFPEEGRVGGKGSCNHFFGSVAVSGESIKFSQLGSTKMACLDSVMDQETKYFRALENAERFTMEGSTLLIYAQGMDKPLRFVPKAP
jgi:heat shock protein HslJ